MSNNSTYRVESEMRESVSRWLSQSGMAIRDELQTAIGVCDLVGCRLREPSVRRRRRQRQVSSLGPTRRIAILLSLPEARPRRGGISLDALASKLGHHYSAELLNIELNHLVRARHARVTRTGRYLRVNGWAPLFRRLVAVEMKLRRVEEVLYQAARNRAFAVESYAAMPLEVARRLAEGPWRARFRALGVGLVGVASGECLPLIRAERIRKSADPVLQMHVVERFWQDVSRGSSSSSPSRKRRPGAPGRSLGGSEASSRAHRR